MRFVRSLKKVFESSLTLFVHFDGRNVQSDSHFSVNHVPSLANVHLHLVVTEPLTHHQAAFRFPKKFRQLFQNRFHAYVPVNPGAS